MTDKDNIITGNHIPAPAPATKTTYIVMARYEGYYWSAFGPGHDTAEQAARSVNSLPVSVEAWRIVCIDDLPVENAENEV